jgi:hypothetical protein
VTHAPIFNGDGHYCTRCGQAWDTAETPPAVCATTAEETATGVGRGIEPPTVIALCGVKGSGKDTAAAPLLAKGFANVKMADGLKIMLRAFLAYRGARADYIDRLIDGDLKETPTPLLNGRTARHAMQTLGDWGREEMQRDFWLDATMDRLKQVGDAVITDVRYPNEAARVRGLGIPLVRVERPGLKSTDTHSSETQIRDLPVTGVLLNLADSAEAFQAHAEQEFPRLTGR